MCSIWKRDRFFMCNRLLCPDCVFITERVCNGECFMGALTLALIIYLRLRLVFTECVQLLLSIAVLCALEEQHTDQHRHIICKRHTQQHVQRHTQQHYDDVTNS